MPDLASLVAFLTASFVIAVVPGPTGTVIIASALSRGTLAGMANSRHGLISMVGVVALGLEAIVGLMGWAFERIKLVGAAYLVWLGYRMARSSCAIEHLDAERHRSLRGYVAPRLFRDLVQS